MLSIRRCFEKYYEDYTFPSQPISGYKNEKLTVFLHPKLKTSLRAKAISKIYENYFNFYFEEIEQGMNVPAKRYATVFINSLENEQKKF